MFDLNLIVHFELWPLSHPFLSVICLCNSLLNHSHAHSLAFCRRRLHGVMARLKHGLTCDSLQKLF